MDVYTRVTGTEVSYESVYLDHVRYIWGILLLFFHFKVFLVTHYIYFLSLLMSHFSQFKKNGEHEEVGMGSKQGCVAWWYWHSLALSPVQWENCQTFLAGLL